MAEGTLTPTRSPTQRRVFAWLFAVATFLFLWTLSPIWIPVFLGVLLTIAVAPWHERVVRRWPRHPRLLAAAITAVALAVIVGAVGYIGFVVVRELVRFLEEVVARWHAGGLAPLYRGRRGVWLTRAGFGQAKLAADLRDLASYGAEHLTRVLETLLSFTSSGLLLLFFTAITSYYLLLDGRRLVAWAVDLVPLPREQTRALIHEFHEVSVAMLFGTGVTSAYQGVVSGLGFWLFHVPNAVVWGALTVVASVVPAVGTALVWIPIVVAEILLGHLAAGLAVLGWSVVLVIGVADYVLRPRLVERRIRMHSLLVFIALFGGVEAFGLLGVILGPLFVALFVAIVRIYAESYRPALPPAPPGPAPPAGR